ncbi:MAG: protein kinase [Bryobacterales bacterium]|nr:protein kinase [Bryobacterales bacterium]
MTPEYASPEQVRGEAVGVASDVYSLGVVLYELLTGHTPLRLHSRVFHEIARVICEESPKPPSTAVTDVPPAAGDGSSPEALARLRESSLVELQSRLMGDLDDVVLKALKQPGARYLSAEQFRQDIERYRNGQPVIARANALAPKLLRAAARHKAPIGAGLLLAVALATGAIRINTGAMQWVSVAALLLALLALATSQRWGRAAARLIVSHQFLVALGFIVAGFALLVAFEPKLQTRNLVRYVNLAAMGVALGALAWAGARRAHCWRSLPGEAHGATWPPRLLFFTLPTRCSAPAPTGSIL